MDLREKAKNYVLLDYVKEEVRDVLKNNPEQLIEDAEILALVKKVNLKRQNKKQKEKTPYVLITINVKPECWSNPRDFFDKVHKSVEKAWICGSAYSFEQREEAQLNPSDYNNYSFHGHHAHILLYREGKRPSEVSREFMSTFKHFVGNQKHINIKYIPEKDFEKVHNYIKGIKADPDKEAKIINDRLMRKYYDLKPYYSTWEEDEEEEYIESEPEF